MQQVQLDVQVREEIGRRRIKKVRESELVPGVVYGGKKKPTAIKIDRRAFVKIRRQHHGEIVFHINVFEGENKLRDYSAVVKEEQHDPVSDQILHVDFKRISLREKIEVKVPIVVKGEAVGVKRDGGSLDHLLWELDAVCLPTQIPSEIEIDVSALEIGDSIQVKDIQLPEGVIANHEPEASILAISAPRMEEESAAEGEEEPEVIGEKKDAAGVKAEEEPTQEGKGSSEEKKE